MSWSVVTIDDETWANVPTPGQIVFDPATFDNRPVYDTGVQVPPWQVVASDAEAWAIASADAETWTASASGVQLWGSGSGAPIIGSVSPESGTSGTILTITGQNFTSVTSVTIDDLEASFTIVDDTTILATVP